MATVSDPVRVVDGDIRANVSGEVDIAPEDSLSFDPLGLHSGALNIATAQTLTRPDGANKLLIQVLTQNARFTLDGTAPTASLGFQLKAGDPPTIISVGPSAIVKIIEELASASLQFQWGR